MVWVLTIAGAYAGLVLLMFLFQGRLLFIGASWGRGAPLDELPGVRVERLALPTGERFRVARGSPPGEASGVIVFFLGNGEDLRSGVYRARVWSGYGLESLVVEYPGYGDSEGAPGFESIGAAADVAGETARERAEELGVPLVAGGSSLGTFSATRLAARLPVERLVLVAPPTSIRAAARHHYPWLPVGLILRHPFDNLHVAPRITCPTLIVHGDRDPVVPFAMGEALARAFAGPCELLRDEGGDHVLDLQAAGPFGGAIRRFLE